MKKYDIFISYRRTAYDSANLIATRLKAAGYRVFFDLETMRSGKFNKQLFDVIDGCKDFIVVLSPNALDRCVAEDDWVRQEIMHALQKKKNIIPILLNGFSWPETMPEGMEELQMYQGVASSPDFFDLAMERLNTYLTSYKYTKQRVYIKWFSTIAVSIAILILSLFSVFRWMAKPLCKEVTEHLTLQICALDFLLEDNKLLVDAWNKIDTYDTKVNSSIKSIHSNIDILHKKNIDTNDKEELNRVIKVVRSNIEGYKSAIEHKLELSSWQDFLISLYGTNTTALTVMEKATEMIFDDIERDMNLMQNIASNKNISPSKKEYVKRSLSLLKPSCESHFHSYLQILNEFPESALEGYNQLATRWVNMPHTGLGLASSEYDKFVERNDKIIQEELAKMNKINLDIQDKVYEQEQKPDSLN